MLSEDTGFFCFSDNHMYPHELSAAARTKKEVACPHCNVIQLTLWLKMSNWTFHFATLRPVH